MPAQFDLKEDVVITGISGRLPQSANIEEFKKYLLEGVNLISETSTRWPMGRYGLPTGTGIMKDIGYFDAAYFSVHPKQAHGMDPQLRMLLEVTYEAIVDAGFNPATLRGTKTGVYVAMSNMESELCSYDRLEALNGYTLLGCTQCMVPNRISYTFDFKGPSYALDSACSSSMYALHHAVMSIKNGECDAAIVAGVNSILQPPISIEFNKLKMLSQDNMCKSFDADANGFARSEAVVGIFLQKSTDARRVYATVLKTKTNANGCKTPEVILPSGEMQYKLMREVYDESGINPENISYVEAHGIATQIGDIEEVNSIAKMFCEGRKKPLLIGSVKSNMGHAEATSGLCAIAKVLIAMENGVIPPNLHYKTPNPNIPALVDGRLRVVDKLTPWNGGLVALNCFGYSGTNAHVVLRSNPKAKLSSALKTKLPKLVAISGRTTEGIDSILDAARVHKEDDEFIGLLHATYEDNFPGHFIRGYEILNNPNSREVADFDGAKRPIWFLFPGMGSQWEGMGRHLLSIETFKNSLERCAAALKPVGVDLMDIILCGTNETYQNILNNFITITAIQVGLVDLLTFLDIHADGIVGHSFGEVACAYADGTITAEQAILIAYWRGKSTLHSDSPPGAMAAVGLSWKETKNRCPHSIFPVCHNSADSVTISGPIDAIHNFIKELQSEGIFAKEVNSSGYAFHSKYIASVGPKLLDVLKKIIPNPKQRSARWISSSIPEDAWGNKLAQFSSAEYHVNNLLSPVLFHEAVAHIQDNAIVIEIAPHSLLQAILRRSLPQTVTNIGLQKRDQKDNLDFFLSSIGKLYTAGGQPKIAKLYPPVTYPVGRGTPMINSLIKWDHSMAWKIFDYYGMKRLENYFIDVDLSKEEDNFIIGHVIDGKIIYPAAGYIMLAWKAFANLKDIDREKMPIICENMRFQRATVIPKKGSVKFMVDILIGSGDFQIREGGSVVVTGKIRTPEDMKKEKLQLSPLTPTKKTEVIELTAEDIYKEFRLRGYDYSGAFQGIKKADNRGIIGELNWCNNWISFVDSMFQFGMLGNNNRELYIPIHLQYLLIDPVKHIKLASELSQKSSAFPIYNYKNINCLKSGGVEIRHLKLSLVSRRQQIHVPPSLERYTFIPYETNKIFVDDHDTANNKLHMLNVLSHIVCENILDSKLNVAEIADGRKLEALLIPYVLEILRSEPVNKTVDSQLITSSPGNYTTLFNQSTIKAAAGDMNTVSAGQDLHLILAADLLRNKYMKVLQHLSAAIKDGGFIILEETNTYDKNLLKETDLKCVAELHNSGRTYVLLKKIEKRNEPIIIQITETNFSWLEQVKAALKKAKTTGQEILLVSEGQEISGLIGFTNCLRLESGGTNTRYVLIQDKNAPKFSLSTPFYAEQLGKQMMANVFKEGQWGSYRYLRVELRNDVPSLKVNHAFVNTLIPGDLNSLRWIESSLKFYKPDNYPGRQMCSVYYASLNHKDIMLATGKSTPDVLSGNMTSEECILGLEFSGRDSKGRRIMGMLPAHGLATTVLADSLFTWEVPDKWTLEEAATIPVAYATSYYTLFICARLQRGDTVLIHDGSSSIGQASITIALHMGCKVFTTAGSQQKRNFIKKTFSQLSDKNIGHSTDTNFEQLIMTETNGRGVDIILNSLAEEKLQASVRCLAIDGRFFEIGQHSLAKSRPLGMSIFLKNTSYRSIVADSLFATNTPEKKELIRLISEGILSETIRPLSRRVFSKDQIVPAFTHMVSNDNIDKGLLKIRDEEAQKQIVQPSPKTVTAIPRTYMNPDKSYVLVGGLGRFGLELANWIIGRGAKHIVLTSRSGIRTGYQSLCVRRWRESGINVVISTVNCVTLDGAEQLIKESNKLAPVGGIFNLAAVLNDGLIEKLNEDNFKTVTLPKIDATKHLDTVCRKHCPSLDYFVVFSSVSCGRGKIGQTNYGLANSAMERIVEKRQSDGLPGLAIQLGAVGDVGLIIETMGDNETENGGTFSQRINSCLLILDTCLQQLHPVVSSMVLAKRY